MAVDLRKLKPGELSRLLNSTPLGTVTDDRRLKRYRTSAGFRIAADGDLERVDIYRFTAWLVASRHGLIGRKEIVSSDGTTISTMTAYEAHKESARKRQEAMSLSGRDIGELPAIVNPERRAACERSFRAFCETYFSLTFQLAWSPDHLRVIEKIETAILAGGLFGMAMPRGSGKTSLCEAGCTWAMLYGHRRFVALIGADEDHAANMLESIKSEIENNELLFQDFPEVCAPIKALEGIHQRASGQLYKGAQTHIGWTAKDISLPVIPGSAASGVIIRVAGITGRIRGMKHKRHDGISVRPDLVLVDDPQTDESARSPSQCEHRERIVAGAILGLAGPSKKIAGLMTLTVVQAGDMADKILNRDLHPQWQGERTKMVYSFPTRTDLWDKYAVLRADGLRQGGGLKQATAFYLANRAAMDLGGKVAWEARFNSDEASALQHAMNLKLQNEYAFFAEYQNEPMAVVEADDDLLDAAAIAQKINNRPESEIPESCSRVTAFVDVQDKALYYAVVAWEDDFTGYVVEYGTEPDQKLHYFTLRDIKRTLKQAAPKAGQEAAIYAGLERVAEHLLGREWYREDGAQMKVDRMLIDANWPNSTDVVYQFCRQSLYSGRVMPSHGKYVGASSTPFSEYKKKRGERVGMNWRIPMVTGKRASRHVLIDVNSWKSFVQARLAVPMGDPGCLSIWGKNPTRHRAFSEQLASEYRVRTEGRGRAVDEWKIRVASADNHWLDCVVGCAVAASIEGVSLQGVEFVPVKRVRKSFLQMQAEAAARSS